MFNTKKLKLKHKKFELNTKRNQNIYKTFSKTSSGIESAVKLFLALFVTPMVVITDLFSSVFFLTIAGGLLSIGYLLNFSIQAYKDQISKTEALLTLIGLGLTFTLLAIFIPGLAPLITFALPVVIGLILSPTCLFIAFKSKLAPYKKILLTLAAIGLIAVVVFLFPGFIGVVTSSAAASLATQASIIIAAINTFFVTKEIVIPPLKLLIEKVIRCIANLFGINVQFRKHFKFQSFFIHNDRINVDDERAIINRLLKTIYEEGVYSINEESVLHLREDLEEKLSPIYDLISYFEEKINNLNSKVFGNIRYKDEINTFHSLINQIVESGDMVSARKYLSIERDFEHTRLQSMESILSKIRTSLNKLKKSESNEKEYIDEFNTLNHTFFYNYKKINNIDEAEAAFIKIENEFLEAISTQKNRYEKLNQIYVNTEKSNAQSNQSPPREAPKNVVHISSHKNSKSIFSGVESADQIVEMHPEALSEESPKERDSQNISRSSM